MWEWFGTRETLNYISARPGIADCRCSSEKLQYRHHQNVLHQWPAVSCDKDLIRSFPDIRHLSASRTFLLWKIFLISLVNIFIFTGTWLSFWIRNIGGYFISLLASDTGERSLWLWWCSPLMDSNDKRNFNCKLKPIVTPPWISLIFDDKILYHWTVNTDCQLWSVKCEVLTNFPITKRRTMSWQCCHSDDDLSHTSDIAVECRPGDRERDSLEQGITCLPCPCCQA